MNQKPLRILMVLHMPWNANLGGPQTQMNLADEFKKLGHIVEKFDYYDAFPEAKWLPSKLLRLFDLIFFDFSARAKSFIQKNAHRFDIIDAHQGNLPFSKKELGFNGLVVARSAGLYAFHQEFALREDKISKTHTDSNPIKCLLQKIYRIKKERDGNKYIPSLNMADAIIVLNEDEETYINEVLNLGEKCIALPNGLTNEKHKALSQFSQTSDLRLMNKQIVFIGSWSPGKGSRDWTKILQMVKRQVPEVSFLFLGTGTTPERVLNDLELSSFCDWVTIIPNYENEELPNLLSNSTIGVFPSHVEGFGIAVLEKLSSGLPTVAYDIPGPRVMLRHIDNSLLIPLGNTQQMSNKIVELLNLDRVRYSELSARCVEAAQLFCWSDISKKTLNFYQQQMEH
ncbi:glycosyltransferase family 4 protein [Aphanizomenon sp. PH219]|nr:glycosyltransferase family 4 protein [Aphanizomenon sp. 202]MDK2459815.1 glycosyltransferase family 4 protein [Aphanizomenon sp. PH219]